MGQSGAPPFHELVPSESFLPICLSLVFPSMKESSGLKFLAFVLCMIPIIVGVGHIEETYTVLESTSINEEVIHKLVG